MPEGTEEKAEPLLSSRAPSTAPPPRRGGRRARAVPAVYGVVSLVLVVAAVTFALSSPPPSTPPLAEVAPAPQDQIEVERVEQSSRFGEGQGGEGEECVAGDPGCEGVGQEQQGIQPTAPPTSDPNVSQADFWPCVMGEGGPRQTEDPQSPPCIGKRFEGDNGGSTWTGVTRDTIRVAVPDFSGCWGFGADGRVDCSLDGEVLQAFASHVNTHYELYGRRLELVEVAEPDGDDPAAQRAYASQITSLEPFAVLGWGDGELPFHRSLADAELISFATDGTALSDEGRYDRLHPYVWGVYPTAEASVGATAELVCRSLVGRPAQHGGADVAERPRRFGIVQQVVHGQAMPTATLVSRLEACGAPHTVRTFDRDTDDRELVLAAFADDEVTTVLCVCADVLRFWTQAADGIGYEPEWLMPGSSGTTSVSLGPQAGHVFGLAPRLREPSATRPFPNPNMRYEEQFWFHVLKEQKPDWQHRNDDATYAIKQYGFYAQLVMLASGIQWAGPELTPDSFAEALQGLTYPNPGVGQAPWFQPGVGFGPADHSFNSDFALVWFDAPTPEEEQLRHRGQFCYVGGGARFTADSMLADADDRFFDPEAGCR